MNAPIIPAAVATQKIANAVNGMPIRNIGSAWRIIRGNVIMSSARHSVGRLSENLTAVPTDEIHAKASAVARDVEGSSFLHNEVIRGH